MLSVTIEQPDGTAFAGNVDFGAVLPGQVSADVPFRVRNDGDSDLPAPRAWVQQVSTADGEMQAEVAGILLTAEPQALPPLAVGAWHTGVLRWVTPSGTPGLPVDTGDLRVEPI
ncbi:hypothetical protein DM785_02710 [Deinococcus actinosclerus]|nr:hypothetical protein DM785_02710 [Deinococcus actinosclerus]